MSQISPSVPKSLSHITINLDHAAIICSAFSCGYAIPPQELAHHLEANHPYHPVFRPIIDAFVQAFLTWYPPSIKLKKPLATGFLPIPHLKVHTFFYCTICNCGKPESSEWGILQHFKNHHFNKIKAGHFVGDNNYQKVPMQTWYKGKEVAFDQYWIINSRGVEQPKTVKPHLLFKKGRGSSLHRNQRNKPQGRQRQGRQRQRSENTLSVSHSVKSKSNISCSISPLAVGSMA